MTRQPGIYAITHELSGKMYVGSAVNMARRFRQHRTKLNAGVHHNKRIQASWNKYGEAAFIFETLLYCSKENLLMYEQLCIDGFDSVSSGYNISPLAGHSFLGVSHTNESRLKISEALKGRAKVPFSLEHKSKLSAWQIGKVLSPEHKAKISEGVKGTKHTPESRSRMSEASKKRLPMSIETRRKIAASLKGRKPSEANRIALDVARRRPRNFTLKTVEDQGVCN